MRIYKIKIETNRSSFMFYFSFFGWILKCRLKIMYISSSISPTKLVPIRFPLPYSAQLLESNLIQSFF